MLFNTALIHHFHIYLSICVTSASHKCSLSSLPHSAHKIFNSFVSVLAMQTMRVADSSPRVPGHGGVSISSDGCHMRNRLPGLLATLASYWSRARIPWLWLVGAMLAPRDPPSLMSCDHHLPSPAVWRTVRKLYCLARVKIQNFSHTWRSTMAMSIPRAGILSLARFNSGQD